MSVKNWICDKTGLLEKFFIDIIFPIQCLGCSKEGGFLCKQCLKKIPILSEQKCPLCENAATKNGSLCKKCEIKKSGFGLSQLIVASDYKDELLKRTIHLFKYKFAREIAPSLGQILLLGLQKNTLALPDLIIPVPLHPRRLRWRGFNQSELLSQYLCENLAPGIKIASINNLIIRQKYTRPQMNIKNYNERLSNVENAFGLSPNCVKSQPADFLRGKKILLVDDICTTGATIFECAKILKPLNPRSISAVVLARQS